MDPPPDEDTSAVRKVSAITELLEIIIDNLPIRNLIGLFRVCRHWQAVIKGLPILRDFYAKFASKLTDEPEAKDLRQDPWLRPHAQLNPLLPEAFKRQSPRDRPFALEAPGGVLAQAVGVLSRH